MKFQANHDKKRWDVEIDDAGIELTGTVGHRGEMLFFPLDSVRGVASKSGMFQHNQVTVRLADGGGLVFKSIRGATVREIVEALRG